MAQLGRSLSLSLSLSRLLLLPLWGPVWFLLLVCLVSCLPFFSCAEPVWFLLLFSLGLRWPFASVLSFGGARVVFAAAFRLVPGGLCCLFLLVLACFAWFFALVWPCGFCCCCAGPLCALGGARMVFAVLCAGLLLLSRLVSRPPLFPCAGPVWFLLLFLLGPPPVYV